MPNSEANSKKENVTTDYIYEYIKKEIVEMRIRPGDKLSENNLCEKFSVSRTPIRAALQHLSQDGFVNIVPHSGSIVTGIRPEIADQFIYMRISLETSVLKDFIRSATPLQVEEVRHYQLLHRERAEHILKDSITDNQEINGLFNMDLEIHRSYFTATKKEYIWSMLMQPQPDYSRLLRLDMLNGKNIPDVIKDHEELLHIIENGEIDRIEGLLSDHFYGAFRRLNKLLFSDEFKKNFS